MPEVRRGSLQLQVRSDPELSHGSSGSGSGSGNGNDTRHSPKADDPDDDAEGDARAHAHARDDNGDTERDNHPQPPPPLHSRSTGEVPTTSRTAAAANSQNLLRPTTRVSSNPDQLPRRSLSYALRPTADAYYDSRAGTHREWKRRHKTLDEYYDDNPQLLPQLPFTWHHGRKRWRLFLFAFLVFVDASAVPIALYYGMAYAGHVEGWIIFAIVTTIWGGPTYLEFAIRTLRLIKKERFYRPLGTTGRWAFDLLHWASVLTIAVVTALFVIGSAPHNVWLRVLCMPAPAILYCLGGVLALLTLYHRMGWAAPFRISSTPKGDKVLPGAYYFVEDVVAVNAGAGRPFREALAARYKASPRFQRMLYVQSLFWSIPALILAVPLTVIAVIPPVPATGAYGVCWAVPFLWAALWGVIAIYWCKRDMVRERLEWQGALDSPDLKAGQKEAVAPV